MDKSKLISGELEELKDKENYKETDTGVRGLWIQRRKLWQIQM